MATAIFFEGGLHANDSIMPIPKLYISNSSATSPPFPVTTSAGVTAVYVDETVTNSAINIVATEPSSPLWIRFNGQTMGDWATVYNLADNTYHTIYEMPDGDRLEAKRDPNQSDARIIGVRYVKNDNTVFASLDWAIIDSNVPYACFTVFENEATHAKYFEYLLAIKNTNTRYSYLTGTHAARSISWGQYAEIIPEYIWSPFEHLTGNDGQFQMDLSQISADVIGDGETQTGDSDASHFTIIPRTSLYNMSVNMLDGQEYTIAYCGDNYLTCTKRTVVGTQSTSINLTLKFYFRSDTLIYTCPEISIIRTGTTAPNDYYLSIIYDADNEVAAPDLINEINVLGSNVYYYNNFSLPSETQLSALYIWLQDNANAQSSDPYGTGSTDNGGDPEGNRLQDHLTDSTLPTCGGLDLGFVTLYRPTDTQLRLIAQFLWSDNVLDNFKKYFNNFADNILSLYSLPYTPSNLPTKTFVVGNMTSEIIGVEYCSVRYFDIDMGQVEIKNKWGSYLDYSPYTKIEIYLPYLGLHSLDTDELMSPTRLDGSMPDTQGTVLSLVYRLDIMTGIIVAKIKVRVYNKNGSYTDQIRYQFSGRVGSNTPLTGQTFEAMVNAVVTAGAGLATTIATGGLTAPMSAAAAVTATVQAQKPSVERVGSISGDASMLATNVPYICITVPNKPLLDDQQKFTGFPSYKSGLLSSFSGYTEVIDAHVEGISCTEEERTKILQYLKEGVIL